MTRKVTTHKRRFVHIEKEDGSNTICGASPHYYVGHNLVRLTDEEAAPMHHCKRCFPNGPEPMEATNEQHHGQG